MTDEITTKAEFRQMKAEAEERRQETKRKLELERRARIRNWERMVL